MSVKVEDVIEYEEAKGTPGGSTYSVLWGKNEEAKVICFRPIFNQPEYRCTSPAGYGTSHVGQGACKRHGGADRVMPISTGKYAIATKNRLAEKIEGYLGKSRTELLDLSRELATLRAIYDEQMEHFPTPDDESYGLWFHRMTELIGSMGTLVEKISRTDSRNTLTAQQVLYFKAVIVDIFLKYVADPNIRARAVQEMSSRLGGDTTGINLQPYEYTQ